MDQEIHDLFAGLRQDLRQNLTPTNASYPPCDVPKFNGNDFHKWQKQMTFYLKEADLWHVVIDPTPDVNARDGRWTRQNDKALGTIFNRCHDEQQELIDECSTAKAAWDTLERLFAHPSAVMLNQLLDNINDIRIERWIV